MKLVHVNVDWMQVFVMIDSIEVMINAVLNAKNSWIKLDMMMSLCRILYECKCDKSCNVGESQII